MNKIAIIRPFGARKTTLAKIPGFRLGVKGETVNLSSHGFAEF
jgi:hypothetical protein